MIRKAICFLVLMHSLSAYASYIPNNFDTLNYTSVCFEFPWIDGANEYEIVIQNTAMDFGNIALTIQANKKVVDNLEFGCTYTWKVRGINSVGAKMSWSPEIQFTIGTSSYIDDQFYHYKGKKVSRSKATKGLLFFDYGRVGVNRVGRPVWYLPKMDSLTPQTLVRDVKMTNEGTFTALLGETAVEFDRNGKVLWQAPDNGLVNGEQREFYHHEFTKTPSGNYLVLGLDHVMRKIPNSRDSILVEFGTIIEYNYSGDIVWQWNSNDYFTDADLFSRPRGESYDVRTHMNACTTNGEYVFAGYRNLSRIIVIHKKSGKVVESYGGYGVFKEPHSGTGFFRRQHDALQLSDGNLAVFNNDSVLDPEVVSSVVIFSRQSRGKANSEKIMDFKMDFDSLTDGKSVKTGNVNELDNGNLLVNLGSINRAIELSREGEVVWSMSMEQYDTIQKMWKFFPQYRVSHASSLYPYAFSTRLEKNRIIDKKRTITVRIYNVGSEEDDYSILYAKKRKRIKAGNITVLPGEVQDFTFQVRSKSSLELTIKSDYLVDGELITVSGFH